LIISTAEGAHGSETLLAGQQAAELALLFGEMAQAVLGDDDGAVDDQAEIERTQAHQVGADLPLPHPDRGHQRCRRRSLDPSQPLGGDDRNDVRKALRAALWAMLHADMTEAVRLMLPILHCGPPDAGPIGNLVDRELANADSLNFAGDDASDSPLALGVMMAHRVGHRARAAKHSFALTTFDAFFGRQSPPALTWGET
jgi:hypothetical protein